MISTIFYAVLVVVMGLNCHFEWLSDKVEVNSLVLGIVIGYLTLNIALEALLRND